MMKSKNIHSLDFAFRLVNGHGLRKNHAMLQDFESYIFYVHKTEEEKSINKKTISRTFVNKSINQVC